MKYLLLLLSLLFYSLSYSQLDYYSKRYNIDDHIESRDMTLNHENGFAVVGKGSWQKAFICYSDEAGSPLWSKEFSNSTYCEFNSIVQLHDSTFVVVGSGYNSLNGENGVLCVRIDRFGDTLWTKSIEYGSSESLIGNNIIQTKDSNLLILGTIQFESSFALKMDLNGNEIWNKIYDFDAVEEFEIPDILSVKEHENGDLIMVGRQFKTVPNETRGFVMRTTSTGIPLWSKNINQNETKIHDVLIKDNDYYLLSLDGVIKTDSILNIVWAKSQLNPTLETEIKYEFTSLYDNSLLMASNDDFMGYAIRFDENGNTLEGLNIQGKSIKTIQDKDSNLLILSNGPVYGVKSPLYQGHYGISKIDSSLNNATICTWDIFQNNQNVAYVIDTNIITWITGLNVYNPVTTVQSISMVESDGCVEFFGSLEETEANFFNLTPNPVSDNLHINRNSFEQVEYSLLDQNGSVVKRGFIEGVQSTIKVGDIKSGFYFVRIGLQTEKFIKN